MLCDGLEAPRNREDEAIIDPPIPSGLESSLTHTELGESCIHEIASLQLQIRRMRRELELARMRGAIKRSPLQTIERATQLVHEITSFSEAQLSCMGKRTFKSYLGNFIAYAAYTTTYDKDPVQILDVTVDKKTDVALLQEAVNDILETVSFPDNNWFAAFRAMKASNKWEFNKFGTVSPLLLS